jgi:hypothetical protein
MRIRTERVTAGGYSMTQSSVSSLPVAAKGKHEHRSGTVDAAQRHNVQLQLVGKAWDAVRASARVGDYALKFLGQESGAVIQDRHGPLYWLVTPGAADGWKLQQVHVLSAATAEASYVGVPPAHWTTRPGTHWRIPVGPNRYLTDAALLCRALALAIVAELGSDGEDPR